MSSEVFSRSLCGRELYILGTSCLNNAYLCNAMRKEEMKQQTISAENIISTIRYISPSFHSKCRINKGLTKKGKHNRSVKVAVQR
jgi:hypothetical protein